MPLILKPLEFLYSNSSLLSPKLKPSHFWGGGIILIPARRMLHVVMDCRRANLGLTQWEWGQSSTASGEGTKTKEETKDPAQCPHREPWAKPTYGYHGQLWTEGDGPELPLAPWLPIAKPPSNFASIYTRPAVFKGVGDHCSAEINTLFNLESILNSFFSSLCFTPQWKQLCHYK